MVCKHVSFTLSNNFQATLSIILKRYIFLKPCIPKTTFIRKTKQWKELEHDLKSPWLSAFRIMNLYSVVLIKLSYFWMTRRITNENPFVSYRILKMINIWFFISNISQYIDYCNTSAWQPSSGQGNKLPILQ